MSFLCSICSELLNSTENVIVTNCGHLFHYNCLIQWLPRSDTCPQCRDAVTQATIRRIYPTAAEGRENMTMLQAQLEAARLQLRVHTAHLAAKDKAILKLTMEYIQSKMSLEASQKELVYNRMILASTDSEINYLRQQSMERDYLDEENELLKKNLEALTVEQSESKTKITEYREEIAWLRTALRSERVVSLNRVKKLSRLEADLSAMESKCKTLKYKCKLLKRLEVVPGAAGAGAAGAGAAGAGVTHEETRDTDSDNPLNKNFDERDGNIPSELTSLINARNSKPAGGNENASEPEPNIFRRKVSVLEYVSQVQFAIKKICYFFYGKS